MPTLRRTVRTAALTSFLASAAFAATAANAATFGFEELIVPFNTAVPIPDGYAGATWDGWVLRRTGELDGTGLNTNDTSGALATATSAAPTIVFAAPVVFDRMFLINPRTVASFDLYLGADRVLTGAERMAPGAEFVASGYEGHIDRVVFHYPGYGISIDDVAIAPATPVPEVGTAALLLTGLTSLCGVGVVRRRRVEAA